MKTHISHRIIKAITGYDTWANAWKIYHMAKANGIDGLSGEDEKLTIESLRPDYQKEEIIH